MGGAGFGSKGQGRGDSAESPSVCKLEALSVCIFRDLSVSVIFTGFGALLICLIRITERLKCHVTVWRNKTENAKLFCICFAIIFRWNISCGSSSKELRSIIQGIAPHQLRCACVCRVETLFNCAGVGLLRGSVKFRGARRSTLLLLLTLGEYYRAEGSTSSGADLWIIVTWRWPGIYPFFLPVTYPGRRDGKCWRYLYSRCSSSGPPVRSMLMLHKEI